MGAVTPTGTPRRPGTWSCSARRPCITLSRPTALPCPALRRSACSSEPRWAPSSATRSRPATEPASGLARLSDYGGKWGLTLFSPFFLFGGGHGAAQLAQDSRGGTLRRPRAVGRAARGDG